MFWNLGKSAFPRLLLVTDERIMKDNLVNFIKVKRIHSSNKNFVVIHMKIKKKRKKLNQLEQNFWKINLMWKNRKGWKMHLHDKQRFFHFSIWNKMLYHWHSRCFDSDLPLIIQVRALLNFDENIKEKKLQQNFPAFWIHFRDLFQFF